jgi:triosephosphate isomerase (TIM)
MPERRPLVAANWKMHKTVEETEAFLASFLPRAERLRGADLAVCPPFLALRAAVEHCAQSHVRVLAQNAHEETEGAFTGEISLPMLAELGVDGVILGHSERRQRFCETDEALSRKVPAALAAGAMPLLCVGETAQQRDAGDTESVLRRQVEADLAQVADEQIEAVVIAYEPVWAIGTGRNATVEQASDAISFIRELLAARSPAAAERARILYGGSVKPENAAELLAPEGIDGALVGGASLDPDDFLAIAAATA